MPVGQAEEMMALALVFVVHVVGAVALVWALLKKARNDAKKGPGKGGD